MDHDKYIGRLLDNRYEIQEVIGVGGMAVVYRARCHRLNRPVAIKIMKDDYSRDEEFRRRFHAESHAVAMLSHPNIVSVYDVSSSPEADYIVMELIDGITLKQYMEKKGILNWKETLHFAIQIAKALEHAHSRGIVHRDIKPHNVMVLKNGSVKVMDFGIARVMSKSNTLTKEALGSVHYISPEQAKGGRVDNRSDIYSLGVVMYEMITGRPPYDGESPVSVAIQHINGGARMPSTLNPNIPGGLEQIIMKAMAHDPANRYSSATAMLYDMDEFRKEPTMLFDYNIPATDAVTKLTAGAGANAAAGAASGNSGAAMPPLRSAAERAAAQGRTPARTGTPARTSGQRSGTPQRTAAAASGAKPVSRNTGRTAKPADTRAQAARRRQEEERREETGNRIATIAIVTCSIVAIIAIGIFLFILWGGDMFKTPENELVTVPSLLNERYTANMTYEGFTIKLSQTYYSEEYEADRVMNQTPEAGTEVSKENMVIYVDVSLGVEPETPVMVDMKGLTLENAISFLLAQGVDRSLILQREEYSTEVEAGKVTRTDPEVDEELLPGKTVQIWISKGAEIITEKMPDLLGKTKEQAEALLEKYGFGNAEFKYTESDEPEDQVVDQSEEPGTELDVTSAFIVYLSKGPKTAKMPHVVGMTQQEAEKTLKDDGFTNYKFEPVDNDAPAGEIVEQSVKRNEEIVLDFEIILSVSNGPTEPPTTTPPTTVPPTTTPPVIPVTKVVTIDLLQEMDAEFLFEIRNSAGTVIFSKTLPVEQAQISVEFSGTGVQHYEMYLNSVYWDSLRVDFTEND